MTTFHLGDLSIEATESPERIVARFLGKSTSRDPGPAIQAYLETLIEARGARTVVLDFTALEYMNSSSLVPIAKLADRANRESVPMTLRYRSAVTWQRVPFSMLQRIHASGSLLFEAT